MSGSPRILVLRGGAIGDFVVTLPVFQALKKKWPGADIEIWGYPHIAELAVEGGLAARVVSLDRAAMAKFYLPVPSWSEEQEAEVRGFDLILNYLHDPEGQIKSNLLLAGARKVLSGSPIIKRGAASRFLMEPLMDLGLYGESDVPELALGEARMEEGRRALAGEGRSMVIHPGSGGAAKKWPMKRFLEVAARLEAAGWRVFWSFGEADEDERAAWQAAGSPGRELEAGSLGRLAAVLAHADGYLGNDSGVTHLAAAAGCRTLALFGPSDADKWSPKGRGGVRVLRAPADCMGELPVESVWAAVVEWFGGGAES